MDRKLTHLEEWEAQMHRDSEAASSLSAREPAYLIARLRIQRGLSQQQLAELVGTQQPSIARLEKGTALPSLSFLHRVAKALGARVEVRLAPIDKSPEE